MDDYLKNHAVYKYAQSVVNKSTVANWEVTKVCTDFLSTLEDDSSPYFFDINLLKKIDGLFQYINFGSGSKQGKPISEGIAPFQIYFIANMLCWKHKDNPKKRKNETGVLLIGRKNGGVLPL